VHRAAFQPRTVAVPENMKYKQRTLKQIKRKCTTKEKNKGSV